MWTCLECGKRFRSVRAAEKAAFGENGCPRCGSSDIDDVPVDADGWSEVDQRLLEQRHQEGTRSC
jgi:hypothetical protein